MSRYLTKGMNKYLTEGDKQRIILCERLGWKEIESNNNGRLIGYNSNSKLSERIELPKLDWNLIHAVLPTLSLSQIVLLFDHEHKITMQATFEEALHALLEVIKD